MKDFSPSSADHAIVHALLEDRRRNRRWKNIRFFVWLLIAIALIFLIFSPKKSMSDLDTHAPYVSLLRLNGAIMPGMGFSAEKTIPLLTQAFSDKKTQGVMLVINSPGGSAVQSALIHDKILQLKAQYKKKVIVVGEDALASGAYLIASAADKIYVNDATLTGSIGVVYSGFGLADTIQKLGISRRVFTAGAHKDRLDPFMALDPNDVTKMNQMLTEIHGVFINDVIKGRGNRLRGNQQDLFSGDFWTGQDAVKLGLADQVGNMWDAMKNEFNVNHYKNFSSRPSLLQAFVKGVDTQLRLDSANQTGSIQASL